eukprot:15343840-Ditylum_brightwellii.AAC.1
MKYCNTAQFDKYRTHVGDDKPMPSTMAIGEQPVTEKDLSKLTTNTFNHPYLTELTKLFQVPSPTKDRALSLEISECDYYLFPFM